MKYSQFTVYQFSLHTMVYLVWAADIAYLTGGSSSPLEEMVTFSAPSADMELDRDWARDEVEWPGGSLWCTPYLAYIRRRGVQANIATSAPLRCWISFLWDPWVVVVGGGGTFKLELDVCWGDDDCCWCCCCDSFDKFANMAAVDLRPCTMLIRVSGGDTFLARCR